MDNTASALVVGLCSHGLAISRSLHRRGIEVHAFEANSDAPGFRTNSATVHQVASINDERLIGDLLTFRSSFPPDRKIIIYPTNDNNVRIIAEQILRIQDLFIVSWAQCSSVIIDLLQKDNIEDRCVEAGLSYPKSRIANNLHSLAESLSGLESPFIVKPVKPQSGFKALKFQTQDSLVESLGDYSEDFPVIIQEWIAGTAEDLYFCAMYMDNGIALHCFVGRKLDSYPPALGQTTVAITHDDDDLVKLSQQFFSGLNISGPVSVEFKRDEKGNYWVIEPTIGRSDFWLGLCVAAGLDLPLVEYEISTNVELNAQPGFRPEKTIWFDSDRDSLAPLRYAFKWLSFSGKAYKPVFSYFNIEDMAPFYHALYRTIKRIKSNFKEENIASKNVLESNPPEGSIEIYDSFNSIPETFKDIMREYSDSFPFFSIAWFENFRKNVANHIGTVEILCLSDGRNNALAILPILRHDVKYHGINLKKISSLCNYYSPRFEIFTNGILCDRKFAFLSFFNYIKSAKELWDVIDIFPMFRESITDIRDTQIFSYPYHITENFQQPIKSEYSSYIESRPSKHVNTIKRKHRKLERERSFSFDINFGDEHIKEIMYNYHAVYHRSWKIDEPFPDYIDGMVNWAAENRLLRLGRLIIDEKVVASQIWIVSNETAYIYKLAYDRSYSEYSPGTLLTNEMLKHVINNDRVKHIDFLLGNDSFKKDWMDITTSVYGIEFPNMKSFKGILLALSNTLSNFKRNWVSKKAWYEG